MVMYSTNIVIVMRLAMLAVTLSDQLMFKWEVDANCNAYSSTNNNKTQE